jgi:hypothetical protein
LYQLSESQTSSGIDSISEDEVDFYELKIQSCYVDHGSLNTTRTRSSKNLFLYLNFYEGISSDFTSPPPKS